MIPLGQTILRCISVTPDLGSPSPGGGTNPTNEQGMERNHLMPVIILLMIPSLAAAQNFTGNYSLQDPQGTTSMSIHQDAGGKVSGTITMDDGSTVNLQGEIKGTEVIGIASMGEKNTLFKLHFQGAQLIYTMIDVTADGKPDLANAQQFPFTREGGGSAPPATGGPSAAPMASGGFGGEYAIQTETGPMTLSLQEDADGRVTGTMTDSSGGKYNLDGAINAASGMVMGILVAPNGTQAMFKVQPMTEGVGFAFTPVGGGQNASLENAQMFTFTRTGGASGGGMPPSATGGNPLARGAQGAGDPFTGTFADGKMQVQLSGGGGRYQGQIQFQGQSFPLTAQSPDGRSLTGKFSSGADSFEFTGSLQGATLNFVTGGTTYQLRRQGGAPPAAVNPLGGSAARSNPGASGAAAVQPIAGGSVVNDPSMGVRFSVPQGWKYQKQQATYIMGHDTTPGMILVTPHTSNSIQQLAATANEPLYQAEDGQLMVTGAPVTLANNMLAADYGGVLQGKQARGRIIGVVSPYGGGFLIMAGVDAAHYSPQYAQLAEGVGRSMSFSKPQAPPEAAMWKQKLAGQRLAFMKSGGSSDIGGSYAWSDKKDIYLCSDGSFQASGGFSGSIGTAGGSGIINPGNQTHTGQWSVVGQAGQSALQLRLTSGGVTTFVLSTDGSKTYLDGKRWFVVENPVCQ